MRICPLGLCGLLKHGYTGEFSIFSWNLLYFSHLFLFLITETQAWKTKRTIVSGILLWQIPCPPIFFIFFYQFYICLQLWQSRMLLLFYCFPLILLKYFRILIYFRFFLRIMTSRINSLITREMAFIVCESVPLKLHR